MLALLDEAHHGTPTHGVYAGGSAGNGATPSAGTATSPGRAASDLRGIRRFVLRKDQAGLIERLAKTGRLRLRRTEGEDDPPTMRWDDGQPWRFSLDIRTEAGGKRWAWRAASAGVTTGWTWRNPWCSYPGSLSWASAAQRFDDLGVMPWILRLRYEKEITFVEPQQDLMLGRILAETRVPPLELVESIRLEEINAKPRPCLTLRTPRQNWGLAVRQADRRAGVRLRRRHDPGRADHAPGGLDRAGAGHPPRSPHRECRRHQAVRAGLPRGQGPSARSGNARAAGQADGTGHEGPGRWPAGGSRPKES